MRKSSPRNNSVQNVLQNREARITKAFAPLLDSSGFGAKEKMQARNEVFEYAYSRRLREKEVFEILKDHFHMEPFDAWKTDLGWLIPDLLPKRSVADAWELSIQNDGLVGWATNRFGDIGIPPEDIKQEMRIILFESALYFDKKVGALSTLFSSKLVHLKRRLSAGRDIIHYPEGEVTALRVLSRLDAMHLDDAEICLTLEVNSYQLGILRARLAERRGAKYPVSGDSIFYSLPPLFRLHEIDGEKRTISINSLPVSVLEQMGLWWEDEKQLSETIRTVMNELNALGSKKREALSLYIGIGSADGMSIEAVAKQLGIETNAARSLINTAKKQIEGAIARKNHTPIKLIELKINSWI